MTPSDQQETAAPPATTPRPTVVSAELKRSLAEAREEIRAAHDRGLDPIRVCARLSTSVDEAVNAIWRRALDEMPPGDVAATAEGCALVAHGGYGRRQLAPHSDVDLMVLHDPAAAAPAERVAARLTQDVFDVGLQLGHSLRTVDDALRMARADPVVATSLVESRHLIGSTELFESFAELFRAGVRRRAAPASAAFVAARRSERVRYGESVYLLEPNIKRSRGGLRDVHLLRWLWFAQSGVSDLDRLRSMGVLSKFDHHRLCTARDFLLRVRNELHFGSGTRGDALHRREQVRIAERFGYTAAGSLRPVEVFMRDYFRHASHVAFMANRLTELTTPRRAVARVLDPVLGRSIERHYRIGMDEVTATGEGLERLRRRVDEALRLVDLARLHDRRIGQEAWYAVYRAAPAYGSELSSAAAERFLTILANPSQLGVLLSRLHQLAVLEKVIPEFGEARCLLQFNQQHKFTVDEHCLRAVEMATRFADRDDQLGAAYRKLEDKATLHLSLLLHDLGKGRDEDHSVVGERIAAATAERLRLDDDAARRLRMIVRRHLEMSHLAFRRNANDPELITRFVDGMESEEDLTALFVFTCADIAAVGDATLNDWKVGVLADLYRRSLRRLRDGDARDAEDDRSAREAVSRRLTPTERRSDAFARRLERLPEWFVTTSSPAAVAGAIRRIERLRDAGDSAADAWGGYVNSGSAVEVAAAVVGGAGRGIFSAMAGALSSKGLRIVSAETTLLDDDILLLRYTAEDPQTSPTTNALQANRRIESITAAMVASVTAEEPPKFPRIWGADRAAADAVLAAPSSGVRTDAEASADALLVEVTTIDRVGLLYELARALHDLRLVIRSARIATSGDQVIDVFYVTERDGSKPTGDARSREIEHTLTTVIEEPA